MEVNLKKNKESRVIRITNALCNRLAEMLSKFNVYDTSGTFPCGSRRKNLSQPVNL